MYINVQNVFYSNEQPIVLKVDREIKHISHCEPDAGIPAKLDWELGLLTQRLHQEAVGESTLCHTQSTSSGFACTLRGYGLHQSQGEVKYPHMFLHGPNTATGLILPSHYYLPPLPMFIHYKFLEDQVYTIVVISYYSVSVNGIIKNRERQKLI